MPLASCSTTKKARKYDSQRLMTLSVGLILAWSRNSGNLSPELVVIGTSKTYPVDSLSMLFPKEWVRGSLPLPKKRHGLFDSTQNTEPIGKLSSPEIHIDIYSLMEHRFILWNTDLNAEISMTSCPVPVVLGEVTTLELDQLWKLEEVK